ncbi:MAG TPA: hypothetical protein VKY73_12370 [Polyangiaceae bacterium]|nr:hypothetical protein [Polyangiaceae bacterium]
MSSTAITTTRKATSRREDRWRVAGLQAAHLRLAVVQVSLTASSSADGAPRRALESIRERAIPIIRGLDSSSPNDLLHGVCFAARLELSDARRELLAGATGYGLPDLARARRALYRSLLLIAQVIAANAPKRGNDATLDSLRTFVRVAEQTNPDDIGWFLDVADGELALFILSAHLANAPRKKQEAAVLRTAIAAWKRQGRDPQIARVLRNSILAFANPPT